MYVNGVEVGNKAVAKSIGTASYPLGIGQNYDPRYYSRKLNGRMAYAHIYNTALTAEQVAARYQADLRNGTSEFTPDSDEVVIWYDADGYEVDYEAEKREAAALADMLENGELEMVINDQSQNGFDLSMQSTFSMTKDAEQGMVLDGYAAVDADGTQEKLSEVLSGTNSFMIETTFMQPATKDWNEVFGNGDKGVDVRRMSNGTTIYAYVYNGSGWIDLNPTGTTITAKEWYQMAVIYDGEAQTLFIYLDGTIIGTKQNVAKVGATSYPFNIGNIPDKNNSTNCQFKNVRIYSKALTAEELATGLQPENESVQLWYDFADFKLAEDSVIPVTGIQLAETEKTELISGETITLAPSFRPYYAHTGKEVVYSVDTEGVVSVTEDGVVTGIGSGTVTVTASVKDNPDISASVTLTVYSAEDYQELLQKLEDTEAELAQTKGEVQEIQDSLDKKETELGTANEKLDEVNAALEKAEANQAKAELELLKGSQTKAIKVGDKEEVKSVIYRVTNAEENLAEAYGVIKADIKAVTVADTVVINGVTCKVTSIANNAFKSLTKLKRVVIGKNVVTIGKKAFYGDKALKTLRVKGTALKKVGKNALKGISAKAVIKVTKSKKKAYTKLFKSKGQKKTVKVK